MKIIFKEKKLTQTFEVVERKGIGHPDTLSDHLAEYLSVMYSKWTLKKFGVILHHNFDKLGLLGGKSSVRFGHGKMISPIRVLVNGRASFSFGDDRFDVWALLTRWVNEFFEERLPNINPKSDIICINNLSTASSPGQQEDNSESSARNYWFQPRGIEDLPEIRKLASNDTSLGVGFAPYSTLETLVLAIEDMLNGQEYRSKHPWIGSDIKIMGTRNDDSFFITMCIPQIANEVKTVDEYYRNLSIAKGDIFSLAKSLGVGDLELNVNTRDDLEKNEFYITATGSSIESGDEGLVGRGNRVNRLITPNKIMSMEGAAGKNPVYHIGKIYNLYAHKLAHKIHETFGVPCEISIISQSGRELNDPWIVAITLDNDTDDATKVQIQSFLNGEIRNISDITNDILEFKYPIA